MTLRLSKFVVLTHSTKRITSRHFTSHRITSNLIKST